MKLFALRYHGGKSVMGNNGTGRWITKMLPPVTKGQTYVEPFAGMLGVMLQRAPADLEIANDLNGDVVNWFEMVRDRGDELAEKLQQTPTAEAEFQRSLHSTTDPLERARRFTVSTILSLKMGTNYFNWPTKHSNIRPISNYAKRVPLLMDRLSKVYFLNRPAEKMLARMVNVSHAVIYCDPPYRGTCVDPYGDIPFDRDLFAEVAQEQKGAVAISGYGDEWDHMGWVRNEYVTKYHGIGDWKENRPSRTEVLWTNYQPNNSQLTIFD